LATQTTHKAILVDAEQFLNLYEAFKKIIFNCAALSKRQFYSSKANIPALQPRIRTGSSFRELQTIRAMLLINKFFNDINVFII